MENDKLYIFGAGGHGKVIAELVTGTNEEITAFFDDYPKSDNFGEIPIYNTSYIIEPKDKNALIIAVGDNNIRKKISLRFKDYTFFTKQHKSSYVSPTASIGCGTIIMINAVVNASAKIGKHVIINTSSIIEHECIIDDYVHISPNATLAGNVEIGEGTHIGAGAIIIPGIKIGKWCVIGAGTIVINDIPDGAIVIGNPGKIIKYKEIEI